jgi:hypothetical protein
VKVENKNDLKLNANGRELARVQAQAQLELKERAGANDTPWQRRAAVVHAATYSQGGR